MFIHIPLRPLGGPSAPALRSPANPGQVAALALISLVVAFGGVAFVYSVKATRAAHLESLEIVRVPHEFLVLEDLRVETDPSLKYNRISLKLTGLLRNPGDRACKAPRIVVEALDSKGRPIEAERAAVFIGQDLAAGGSLGLETTELVLTSSQAAAARSIRVLISGVAIPAPK